jgi:hypothetical protein
VATHLAKIVALLEVDRHQVLLWWRGSGFKGVCVWRVVGSWLGS